MISNPYNHLSLIIQNFCKMMEKTATDAFEKRYYEYLSNVKEEKFEKGVPAVWIEKQFLSFGLKGLKPERASKTNK